MTSEAKILCVETELLSSNNKCVELLVQSLFRFRNLSTIYEKSMGIAGDKELLTSKQTDDE